MLRLAAAVRSWALWRLPRPSAVYVAVVVALPVVVMLLLLRYGDDRYRTADLWDLLQLSLLAVISVEGARQVGMPTLVRGRPYQDLLSTWIFAIALVLPAAYVVLASALLVPLLVRGVLRPLHRRAFNVASFALSGLAAHTVAGTVAGEAAVLPGAAGFDDPRRAAWALLAALAAYMLVHTALVTAAILVTFPGSSLREALGGVSTFTLDLAALSLGVLVALAWSVEPLLALAAVPPAVLLQRAVIHDELRAAARTDAKTGLASAAYWLELAQRHVDRAARDGATCGVLLLDVDCFKEVNDTWGHLVGDGVLAEMAGTLRESVRPHDVVGRLGGEEFAVLLPDTSLAEAAAVGERVRARVAAATVAVVGPRRRGQVRVTVSVGVACTAPAGPVISDLLASADAALYRAKAGGRDRVEIGGAVDASERLWLSNLAVYGPPRQPTEVGS